MWYQTNEENNQIDNKECFLRTFCDKTEKRTTRCRTISNTKHIKLSKSFLLSSFFFFIDILVYVEWRLLNGQMQSLLSWLLSIMLWLDVLLLVSIYSHLVFVLNFPPHFIHSFILVHWIPESFHQYLRMKVSRQRYSCWQLAAFFFHLLNAYQFPFLSFK